jgi:16S rRNA (guanine527-N7)-methyltransferase
MSNKPQDFGSDAFAEQINVSRETLKRLTILVERLTQWQAKINLVSKSTLEDAWQRHVLDSAQLMSHLPEPGPLIDLGSGAGFPGLVLALMGRVDVTLVESNGKKCAFMGEVLRSTGAAATIFSGRIEDYSPSKPVRYVTARALTSLDNLIELSRPLLAENGTCLFLKGRGVEEELTVTREKWDIRVKKHPSISDSDGTVLEIDNIKAITRHD